MDKLAAMQAFVEIVDRGSLTGAAELFLPALVAEMNAPFEIPSGPLVRLEMTAFNLEDPEERARFVEGEVKEVVVPGSTRTVTYDPLERVGVGISRLGTSKAVALGAYAYALTALDSGS